MIDWQRRHRHMRFHTATHLLCALVPHPVDGCSITADYARLDFHMTEPLDKEALTAGPGAPGGRSACGGHRWISEAELDANPQLVRSMSVQPPRGLGRVRVMEVDGVDLQPCGGTHVANTAEIGPRDRDEDREEEREDPQGRARLRRARVAEALFGAGITRASDVKRPQGAAGKKSPNPQGRARLRRARVDGAQNKGRTSVWPR